MASVALSRAPPTTGQRTIAKPDQPLSFCDVAGILIAVISSLAHEPRSCEQTVAAAAVVRDILGDAASAAYLYGSAVAGGLRPNSDLDILVVTDRSLSDEEPCRSSAHPSPLCSIRCRARILSGPWWTWCRS
ncbi:nucleotidyltransferase domain-containing protein [Azospirillum brasilense]|uniref:nucleotidyltransferase domain-containing protein n=1 Tax=Azospirillum brasilense TaxID=192 RepID=UPI0018D55659|nr:nucleotidyltransferase domain-containing protein [Azospirillum brasilense]